MKDHPIQWNHATPRDLQVTCPRCREPAHVIRATNPKHLLNLEALCYTCGRYVYLTISLENGFKLNPNQSKRRGGRKCVSRLPPLSELLPSSGTS